MFIYLILKVRPKMRTQNMFGNFTKLFLMSYLVIYLITFLQIYFVYEL